MIIDQRYRLKSIFLPNKNNNLLYQINFYTEVPNFDLIWSGQMEIQLDHLLSLGCKILNFKVF